MSPRFWLWLAIGTGFILRAAYLTHGIPYGASVDEPFIIKNVVQIMRSGDFNPHFFVYPSLYIYAQLAVGIARFIWGAMAGEWQSVTGAPPEAFYLWGRCLTVVVGTATIVIVYRIGRRWSEWHGVIAAALLAVAPYAVRESHFVLTDMPLAFLTTLTLLLTLRAAEAPELLRFALAGAAAGLAGATKYPGAIAVVVPLLAVGLIPARAADRASRAAVVAGGCVAAFLIAAPYTVLDLPAFLNAFAYTAGEHTGSKVNGWVVYPLHLKQTLGWPGFVLAVGGFALAVGRTIVSRDRMRWGVLAAFAAVYFVLIAVQGGLIWGRYALPLVPPACLLAACAVRSLGGIARRLPRVARGWAGAAAVARLILVPPTLTTLFWLRMISKGTTAQLVVRWLEQNVPAGARVVYESGGSGIQFPENRFRLSYIHKLASRTYDDYVAAGDEYLVACGDSFRAAMDAPQRNPELARFYAELFRRAEPLVVIQQNKDYLGTEYRVLAVRRDR